MDVKMERNIYFPRMNNEEYWNRRLGTIVSTDAAGAQVDINIMDDTYGVLHNNGDGVNDGRAGFLLLCGAIVLFMSLPGLALYYSGMVRVQNVLATVMQTFSIVCLITVLWLCFGYTLAFAPIGAKSSFQHDNPFFGGGERLFLQGMTIHTKHTLASTVPETIFCFYQLTFAVITAALICGSFADRMKFGPMLIFMGLWHIVVYCPIAHSVWHQQGFLFQAGALDFAGGNVVHIASGVSGLVSSIVIGNRRGFGKQRFEPHNILLTFMGTCMLWVGWMGFNAGSGISGNFDMTLAGNACLTTQISAATGAMSWMLLEWAIRKQPSVLGMVNGAVAGLVVITPGAGFVDMTGAFIIGLVGGPLCYLGAQVKHYIGIDDALDAFGVHAVGGIIGGIAVGFFANPINYSLGKGVYYFGVKDGGHQLAMQLYAIITSILWSGGITFILLKAIDLTIGLRVAAEDEDAGLDVSIHGETIDVHSADRVAKVKEQELDSKWAEARVRDELNDSTSGKVVPNDAP